MMKKFILSLALSASLFGSGIPVVDAAANAQMAMQNLKQIAEWAKEANRWIETAAHYKNQLDAYAKQLASQSGIRNTIAFIKQVKDIYSEAKNTPLMGLKNTTTSDANGGLNSKAKELMNKFMVYDYCSDISIVEKQNICKSQREATFEEAVFYAERSEAISDRSKIINQLANKLKGSKDIKESADIGNAIQTQVALLEAEKTQIELYRLSREKQKELLQEQKRQEYLKREATAVDFSSLMQK